MIKYGALDHCEKCNTMTYHIDGVCQRELIMKAQQRKAEERQ